MAEFVQQHLEHMIPEIEQMQRVGLFNERETRRILQKRKNFEYKLRRKVKEKRDYLQYIQYEINLLALIMRRRKAMKYKFKIKEIDVPIKHRIHSFFGAACQRFKYDLSLWLSHIEFAKTKGEKVTVGRLYAKMLQIHNKNPKVWIAAAQWEIQENNYMENARALLMKGLQFNKDSKMLWKEYFRMELMNAEKLQKRRKILLETKQDEGEKINDDVLQGKVAAVVYKMASETFPDDVILGLEVLEISRLFDFTREIQAVILNDLRDRHPNSEHVRQAFALQCLHDAANLKRIKEEDNKKTKNALIWNMEEECHRVFEQHIQDLNTDLMWSLYIETCLARLKLKSHGKVFKKRRKHILRLFKCALNAGHLAENLALQWMQVLDSVEEDQMQALEVMRMCTELYPKNASLWATYLTSNMKFNPYSSDETLALFHTALKSVDEKKTWPLWEICLPWCSLHCSSEMESILKVGLNLNCDTTCRKLKEYYIIWASSFRKIQKVRKIYTKLKGVGPVSQDLFKLYIKAEISQASLSEKHICQGFEDAILTFGKSSPDLWLDYIRFESDHGSPENIGKVHHRALSELQGECVQNFITNYTLIQNGLIIGH